MTFIVDQLWMKILASILVGLSGGIAAMLANRKVAVFNDAARPIVGEELKKHKGMGFNPIFASTTFALCIGYVLGLLPLSISKGVLLIHVILLMSDIIGAAMPDNKKWYMYGAGAIGLAWGVGIFWGLQGIEIFLNNFTYPGFGNSLGSLGDAYNAIFGFFPAFVVALMFGWKKGLIALSASGLTFILTALFLTREAHMNATALTMLVGAILMFAFALHSQKKENKKQAKENNSALASVNSLFAQNALNIKKSKWYLVISGGVVAGAVAAQGMVGSPATITAFSALDWTTALIAEGLNTLGFIPLVTLTALATGVYSPAGVKFTTFFGVVGVTISSALIPQGEALALVGIFVAIVLGGLAMLAEVYTLTFVGQKLAQFKVFRSTGDAIRDSINRILNFAFLGGAVFTAMKLGLDMGTALKAQHVVSSKFLNVSGATFAGISTSIVGITYLLNRVTKKPLPDFAIGPIGVLISSVVLNVIYWIIIAAV